MLLRLAPNSWAQGILLPQPREYWDYRYTPLHLCGRDFVKAPSPPQPKTGGHFEIAFSGLSAVVMALELHLELSDGLGLMSDSPGLHFMFSTQEFRVRSPWVDQCLCLRIKCNDTLACSPLISGSSCPEATLNSVPNCSLSLL